MNRVKHSHIVPEFYLHYFKDAKERIHVFDKPKFKSFKSKPNKIAKQSGFYDIDSIDDPSESQIIEHRLGKIESEVAPLYRDLIKRLDNEEFNGFTTNERTLLGKFIYSQMIRTEGSRNLLDQAKKELKKQLTSKVGEDACQDFFKNDSDFDSKSQQLYMLSSNFDQEAEMLNDKIWVVHKNKTKFQFHTSDHPVNTHNHGDLITTLHEIYLPISPMYMLSLLDKRQFLKSKNWNNQVVDLEDREYSKWYNSMTIMKAERQIFSNSDNFKFVKKILTKYPEYRKLNITRVGGPSF